MVQNIKTTRKYKERKRPQRSAAGSVGSDSRPSRSPFSSSSSEATSMLPSTTCLSSLTLLKLALGQITWHYTMILLLISKADFPHCSSIYLTLAFNLEAASNELTKAFLSFDIRALNSSSCWSFDQIGSLSFWTSTCLAFSRASFSF